MTKEAITLEQVLSDLRAIVAERGEDFVYEPVWDEGHDDPQCVYFADSEPSCIVGQWAAMHGVPADRVHRLDINADTGAEAFVNTLCGQGDLPPVSVEAVSALQLAQNRQDAKTPYGQVLKQVEADFTV